MILRFLLLLLLGAALVARPSGPAWLQSVPAALLWGFLVLVALWTLWRLYRSLRAGIRDMNE